MGESLRRSPIRVVLATGVMALTLVGACAETRRSLGDDCLKDEDCLSGICAGLKCVAAPPIIDGSTPAGDSGAPDAAGGDTGADTGFDAPVEAAVDAPVDSPVDSPADVTSSDSPGDVASGG